jgi:transposase
MGSISKRGDAMVRTALFEAAQVMLTRMRSPERKSLTEAAGQSGCAGVKLRQQMAFVGKRQGPGDEERGALCSGSLCSSD